MAWTTDDEDTQTIGTTEATLATSTTNGTFVLTLDLDALANGDEFRFEIWTKVRSTGTSRRAWHARFANEQSDNAAQSPAIVSKNEIVVKAKKISGTDRSIVWELLRQ